METAHALRAPSSWFHHGMSDYLMAAIVYLVEILDHLYNLSRYQGSSGVEGGVSGDRLTCVTLHEIRLV